MSTHDIMNALRSKYAPPAYGFLTEVGNATGVNHRRWADAIAMSIWPSRGLELEGFEIKASRSDWVRERDDPEKAESICKYCDRWWLVVGDAKIVQDGELPPTWGLMALNGKGVKVLTPAPKLESMPITRLFLAALFRRAVEQSVDKQVIDKTYQEAFKAGQDSMEKSCRSSQKYVEEQLEEIRSKVRAFENASGVGIEHVWDRPEKIGYAVAQVLRGNTPVEQIKHLAFEAERVAKNLRELLTDMAVVEENQA